MKKLYILFVLFSILLCGCSEEDESNLSGTFTVKGRIVTMPTNMPLAAVIISITNNNYTIASTRTDTDGMFSLSVDKAQLDNSYYISILEPKTNITQQINLTGIGLDEYDYGNITMYEELTIVGSVVSAPNNSPINGVEVAVTNNSGIIATATTLNLGKFSLIIPKALLDSSSKLSLYDKNLGLSTVVKIPDIEGLEYKVGNIVLYDERNPFKLPVVQYGGYTYVIYGVLREMLSYEDAVVACENLTDYGISNWFLPNEEELEEVLKIRFSLDLPRGYYWTSTYNYNYNKQSVLRNEGSAGYSYYYYSDLDSRLYVVPVARY